MIVGIPKEIKNNENRVGMTPAGVNELVKHGHTVYVQKGAGENSGFPDSSYERVGAKILATIENVYAISEMIVKVKEPIAPEYPLIRKGQLLFTYFHFASDRRLTEAMMSSGATCLAYETVELKDHSLPLLIPMSEVAGRMATQEGARFLERPQGGKGKLMGGVPGVKPAKVLVIGAGVVGYSAARIAAGMGADVTITDLSLSRLRHIDEIKPANIKTLYSSEFNIRAELPTTDLVVGAVLIPGAKAPHLITRDMLSTMLVDVPAPPCTMSTTNCSSSFPARSSSQARMIASAIAGSSSPRSRLAIAAPCLTSARARISSGKKLSRTRLMWKFSTARMVCTPK